MDINVPEPQGGLDLEVAGHLGRSNSHSCCQQECCDCSLNLNKVLRLVKCFVPVKEGVQFINVIVEGDGCMVEY